MRIGSSRHLQRSLRALLLTVGVALGWQCAEGGDPERNAVQPSSESEGEQDTATAPLDLTVRVLASFPHDPSASTQGLLWWNGRLFESTGVWGRSSVRRVDLESGDVERRADLEPHLFGEGLARVADSLWQLTWQSGLAIRYDVDSFAEKDRLRYRGEGWGLCFDGEILWRSDGSSSLWQHSVESFEEIGAVEVSHRGSRVANLNELECAEGWIYANVWQTDQILRIDPASGRVMAVIDASGLLPAAVQRSSGVLNGIAYRPDSQSFLLTGKNWPRLFEVLFVEAR